MTLQLSLFPDAFEVEEAALAALEEMEVERATALVEEARRRDSSLPGLDVLSAAVAWLARFLVGGRTPAEAFSALPYAGLQADVARFLDRSLARHLLATHAGGAFVDAAERVHAGALHLVRENARAARAVLAETLAEGHHDRADLWGYFADASLSEEHPEDANEAYVRALLISAADVDYFRIRHPRLAEIHARHAALPEARELVFTHAWLEGVLAIPPENEWLDARALGHARGARRFAHLVYRDRSRPPGCADLAEREEMAVLDPELFRRFIEACARSERAVTRRARFR